MGACRMGTTVSLWLTLGIMGTMGVMGFPQSEAEIPRAKRHSNN